MANDIFDDSGGYPDYTRQPSKEMSPGELRDLERRARKEGKRDVILSQLVEQQAETAKAMKEFSIRLAQGDRDIARIDEQGQETLKSIKAIGDQATKAAQLIETHIAQCKTRSEETPKSNSLTQTIIANVISGVLIVAIMGGLLAHFMSEAPRVSAQNSGSGSSGSSSSSQP